ncbi:MAG: YggS family pyridoxal phosphate-dependent enzyme [Saprospiraceae bacterium]
MLTELLDALSKRSVTLVAVSKTQPAARIASLYQQGLRHFGENRPQEMLEKYATLPQDIHWHFIGHLQTNKVRLIAPFVQLIHSVDSWKLLRVVDKEAAKLGRVQDCLLQFHIAREESKFGFDEPEVRAMLGSPDFKALQHIRICGVMGMATFTQDMQQVRMEFRALMRLFDTLQGDFFAASPHFRECSMGMSGDWPIAVEEGSTMVRIGSLIFGSR